MTRRFVVRALPWMRRVARADALRAASVPFGMKVVHFSVQGNHLHLIIEAEGRGALSRGMQSLAVRIAIGLNRPSRRNGTVFADRYREDPFTSGLDAPTREPAVWLLRVGWRSAKPPVLLRQWS
jgi:REP element-mobilizing transposase RayT